MIALTHNRVMILCMTVAIVLVGGLVSTIAWTKPVRDSVRVYTDLLAAANRQDTQAAKRLCSARYVQSHPLRPADEGGIVGLPRNIHKNFQAWREGPNVWLCPTNRIGPVYQFIYEDERWRFDGPVGLLRAGGQFVRLADDDSIFSLDSWPDRD